MMRQGVHSGWQPRTAVGPTPDSFAKMRSSTRERFGAQNDRISPQHAKMPNKLVEYVAATFPLTLSLSKGERSHNLPLMVRQACLPAGRLTTSGAGVACTVGAAGPAHRPIQRNEP